MKAFEWRTGDARLRSLGILELAELMSKGCNRDLVGKAVNGKRKVGDAGVCVAVDDDDASTSSSDSD